MANELNILLDTGLTITAKVYNSAGTQQGTTVSMSEVVTSQYSGAFDISSLADGVFPVHFYEGSVLVGSGSLNVKGGAEVSLASLNNFNPSSDTVALVDTVTTNTDMRGTDGAITSLSGIATSAEVANLPATLDNLGVNIQQVNGYDVDGTGQAGSEWGPL